MPAHVTCKFFPLKSCDLVQPLPLLSNPSPSCGQVSPSPSPLIANTILLNTVHHVIWVSCHMLMPGGLCAGHLQDLLLIMWRVPRSHDELYLGVWCLHAKTGEGEGPTWPQYFLSLHVICLVHRITVYKGLFYDTVQHLVWRHYIYMYTTFRMVFSYS